MGEAYDREVVGVFCGCFDRRMGAMQVAWV